MERDADIYQQVWGERASELSEDQPAVADPTAAEPAEAPKAPERQPTRSPAALPKTNLPNAAHDERLDRVLRQLDELQHSVASAGARLDRLDVLEELQYAVASASSALDRLESRVLGELEELRDRIARTPTITALGQSEAAILRAVEELGIRSSDQRAPSAVPDLVVLERVDQLEIKLTSVLAELNRRLSDPTGQLEGAAERLERIEQVEERLGRLEKGLLRSLEYLESLIAQTPGRLEAESSPLDRPHELR